jgi:predicted TIM-barrel fold metal-dependent hydrolase
MSQIARRLLDIDSHEMVPLDMWPEVFSESVYEAAKDFTIFKRRLERNGVGLAAQISGDTMEINHDTVWNVKGPEAPSAIDLSRRVEVMDEMGIDRQLVFPTFGLAALILFSSPIAHEFLGFDKAKVDGKKLGREGVKAHNRWAAKITRLSNGRARPVGIILVDSVGSMIKQAEDLLAEGIRAVMIPGATPPGDTSPADPELDPFWRLLAKANAAVTLHLGTEQGYLASSRWASNVELFQPSDKSTIEFNIEPHRAATIHQAPENYLTTMVLGGVFERHPTLRFGVIELSASWIGPLAERLDMWSGQFKSRFASKLSLKPSEYIQRNVRVTPFHFEPVGDYLERYPQLDKVYAFSTDFPHVEGGKECARVFAKALEDAPAGAADQFFFKNPELLLPV